MKKILVPLVVVGTLLAASAHADCRGLYKTTATKVASTNLFAVMAQVFKDQDSSCRSAITVASQALSKNKGAHMKLEAKKAFDPVVGQANLEAALADPLVTEQLNAARADFPDEGMWLLFQATIFDAEGYYDARDLLVRQIQQLPH
jgi:hypothetical protein